VRLLVGAPTFGRVRMRRGGEASGVAVTCVEVAEELTLGTQGSSGWWETTIVNAKPLPAASCDGPFTVTSAERALPRRHLLLDGLVRLLAPVLLHRREHFLHQLTRLRRPGQHVFADLHQQVRQVRVERRSHDR
jgi:hypothetical protein